MDKKTSPFINDPCPVIAEIFEELWPGKKYTAQLIDELKDEYGNGVYGETIFPYDGSEPLINISVSAPAAAIPELFAHELAHIAAGEKAAHGGEWELAFNAIYNTYNAKMEQYESK